MAKLNYTKHGSVLIYIFFLTPSNPPSVITGVLELSASVLAGRKAEGISNPWFGKTAQYFA